MKEKRFETPPFESRLTKSESIAALLYLPLHLWLLPLLGGMLILKGWDAGRVNAGIYAVGCVYMLLFLGRFLRRDFDPLWDRPFRIIFEVISCYFTMLCFNFVLAMLLSFIPLPGGNPNNENVMSMINADYGPMAAATVFLAPILEELLFRAGIFGTLRHKSRRWAYIIGVAAFALYHVWAYALIDPIYLVFIIQYIPAGYLLCSCYERCNSIWGSIFFHMLVNSVSLNALSQLEGML